MISKEIKKIRESISFTQKELAEALGVPLNTVARWEQGERKPNQAALKALQLLKEKYLPNPSNSGGLQWNKINNDKTFQELVTHLVALELNSPGYIPSSPYIGADEGWDGMYTGAYQNLIGLWSIQAKWKKKNLKEAYSAIRADLLGKKGQPGEIAKARKNNVDYLAIFTNAELSPPLVKMLENLNKATTKPRKIFVWGREALSQRIKSQPWLRYFFFEDPQFPLLVPLKSYSTEIERDLLPGLVGRGDELDKAFEAVLRENTPLITISAPGGYGKSHFLRELAKAITFRASGWQPWFVRPDLRDCQEAIQDELVSGRKYVLFLDDAERFPHVLSPLVAYVRSYANTCRLVIGMRSAGTDIVNNILGKYKQHTCPSFELSELSTQQQIELLQQSADGETIQHPERVVKAVDGVPYFIVYAGKQISGGETVASLDDLRTQLSSGFLNECEMALSDLLNPQQIKSLIIELSLIVPLHRNNQKAKDIIASVLNVGPGQLDMCLRRLEDRKLFRRVGNSLRFRVDMLGDVCLWSRVTASDAEQFVRESLQRWLTIEPQKALTNLAAASQGDEAGAVRKIVQELIWKWSAEARSLSPYERSARIKLLEHTIYLVPDQILDLISVYAALTRESKTGSTDRPVPDMDDYGPRLVGIGRLPGYAVKVAPVVLALTRRNLPSFYDTYKPKRLFSSIVSPLSHDKEDIKCVVGYLYDQCKTPDADSHVVEAFVACATELLSASHEYTDSYEDTFTIGHRVIRAVPAVIEYREFVLERLLKLLHHPNTEHRIAIIEALEEHGRNWSPVVREIPLREQINKERTGILEELGQLLDQETDIAVLSAIETRLLNWWAMELAGEDYIARLLENLDSKRTPLYTAFRYFIASDYAIDNFKALKGNAPTGNRWSWWVEQEMRHRDLVALEPLATTILRTCPTPEKIAEFLDQLEALIEPHMPWANPPLIESIDQLKPDVCAEIRGNPDLWTRVPERFKTPIDRLLSQRSVDHVTAVANEVLAKQAAVTSLDASRLCISLMGSSVPVEQKSAWLHAITDIGSEEVLSEVAYRCSWVLADSPGHLVALLVKLIQRASDQAIRNIAFAVHRVTQKGIPAQAPTRELKEAIKERFLLKKKLDYHDRELLEFAFEGDLHGSLEWVKKRFKKEESDSIRMDFDAVPYHGFKFLEKLVRSANDFESVLRAAYELEQTEAALRFSVDYLLEPVLSKSLDGSKPYLIVSCEKLIADNEYRVIHQELWWRLSRITADDTTASLFSRAIQLADTHGLLEDISDVIWDRLTVHSWSGSLREVPPQFINALEFVRRLKNEFQPGQARLLIEKIEQSLVKEIEGIQQEHEEFLNDR